MKRDRDFVVGFCLGLLLGVLGMAGAAKAAPFTPELEADYAYAAGWWEEAPTGCSSITLEVVPSDEIEGDAGRATIPREGELEACRLLIADTLPPCADREVVLHEYGHLLGLGHSADPASIMYPGGSYRDCEREALGQQLVELEAAASHVQARCRIKTRHRLCRQSARRWNRELAEAAARLDRVQEPQR